jgi:mono/diheme cytochrome c family protein
VLTALWGTKRGRERSVSRAPGFLPSGCPENKGPQRGARASAKTLAQILTAAILLTGCSRGMDDQPRYDSLEPSAFFEDGRSARPLVPGTVPRGFLKEDEEFYTGLVQGRPTERFPVPVTRDMLVRGQERYDIYCAVCHDRVGSGQGMVVQRGFPQPPSFHSDRLRQAPAGHFYDVITRGFGRMPDYASEVPPHDRWAIAAYIRALQLSQRASLNDVPEDKRGSLEP